MSAFRVIPVILYNGEQAVKTVQFSDPRNIGSVINQARLYEKRNADEIIFLDIYAKAPNFKIIKEFAKELSIPFAVGGGIRTAWDAQECFEYGADRIVIGNKSGLQIKTCETLSQEFGAQAIIAAIDYHQNEDIFCRLFDLDPFCGEFMLTCIDREGTMTDPDYKWRDGMCGYYDGKSMILHGGLARPIQAINITSANAIGIGSMFQFTQFTPNDVKRELQKAGIEVRL